MKSQSLAGLLEYRGRLGREIEAEGVGFEPTEAFASLVFKTRAINHSTAPPRADLAGRAHSPTAGASPNRSRLRPMRSMVMLGTGTRGRALAPSMTVLSTNLLAVRTRELADMIETLPVSLAPDHQYERCCELLEQVAIALDLLTTS